MPAVDSLVQDVVDAIVRELHPTRVILFGSRARGDSRPDSDVDLLIVYDGELSKREVKLRVRRLFCWRDFSMDIFVISSDEYERQKKIVSTVGRTADREGVVCYGG
ncbi:MAG TPA: nucleotidyltransferase domain-containing protein [Planctomycetota bacterium]|nr:nucleotidyltransferase domain-containing protein [Planctomycetota bacterium]